MSDRSAPFVIVDYGMGNLKSVQNALSFLDCPAIISNRPEDVLSAKAVILPGVGAFGEAMENLRRLRLVAPLSRAYFDLRKPFLGICLGMQLFAEESEERGQHKGLGFLPAKVRRIPAPANLRLPHVGWNSVKILKRDPFFADVNEGATFYFVHTYCMECPEQYRAATTDYGGAVTAAIQADNLFAAQFHPERSQNNGLRLLRNFTQAVNQQQMASAC